MNAFNDPQYHPYILLLLSAVCGGALGSERQLMPMIMGVPDPWRVAGQIVTGCGFIGGGVLVKDGVNIKGLTTAATIWMTAAIGVAFSADKIMFGIVCTLFTFIILKTKGRNEK